jgi:hypothetical protein
LQSILGNFRDQEKGNCSRIKGLWFDDKLA